VDRLGMRLVEKRLYAGPGLREDGGASGLGAR